MVGQTCIDKKGNADLDGSQELKVAGLQASIWQ